MKDLNQYRDEAYAIAKEHGWHDEEYSSEHWKCLIISELMEAVNADRKDNHANLVDFDDMMERYNDFDRAFETCIKDTVEDELADACIRIFDYAGYLDLDISDCAPQKYERKSHFSFTEYIYQLSGVLMDWGTPSALKSILEYAINTPNIDIFRHIELKMEYNRHREYKHGKLY